MVESDTAQSLELNKLSGLVTGEVGMYANVVQTWFELKSQKILG